jgi:hypothetical protein
MFDWLATKIDNLWLVLIAFFSGIWTDFYNFISDLPIVVVESILNAISSLFASISAPSFLTTGLSTLFQTLPSSVTYFLVETGFFQGLAIYGSGFAFRMLRKVFTLGQW